MINLTLHDFIVFCLGGFIGFLVLVFILVKDDLFKMYRDSEEVVEPKPKSRKKSK
jgi:hypothetical protein